MLKYFVDLKPEDISNIAYVFNWHLVALEQVLM